ncbi:MAG: translation initiation factor IF-2 [Lachnospiraceae bacterium]
MTKLRVHELAKELNKSNKELLEYLKVKNIEVKSHMSSLSDEDVASVRTAYGSKGAPAKSAPTASAPAASAAGAAEKETQEPRKKKNIVHVFRPQNTQSGAKQGGYNGRQTNNQGQRRDTNQGQRRPVNSAPGQEGQRVPNQRPEGQRPQGQRPEGQRPQGQRPEGQRPQGQRQEGQRPQGQRPEGQRPQGQRPEGQRPQGQRPQGQCPEGQRPQGQRPDGQRPQGQRPEGQRSQGQRPYEQRQGQRPQGQRPQGQRPQGQRPDGQRPQGQRPEGQRSQGQRPYEQRQGQRPDGQRQGQRPDGQQRAPGQRFQGQRNDRPGDRNNDRRRDGNRGNAIPAAPAAADQQKQQRSKGKDFKKKDFHQNDRNKNKQQQKTNKVQLQKPQVKAQEKKEEKIKQIILPEILTIKELAEKMKVQPSVIVKKLFLQGKVVTVNQEIDYDTAEEIAMEFEVLCEKEIVIDVIEELLKEDEEDASKMKKRPPVVCVMGHVDHGKTSLLDAIRDTNVIDREAGGITQHIGAYVAEINNEKITFLDTPGHEAFTAMRMRGASSTDIAVLVVAADDGVMPQTVEAINHAKAAGIEIVVAVNKMDKPSANIDRVKQELAEYELIPEDWGGSTIFVPVSARTKDGIPELLEMLLLTAEVLELKANPDRHARGLVIEAELDKGKGSVATVLVQKGTLHVGDAIAAGSAFGKVRAMMDDKGRRVKEAGPSMPVEILGLNDVPNAGEVFVGCDNDKEARAFGETFISQGRVKMLEDTKAKLSLDDLFTRIKAGNLKELGIVVKADVQGSVEAIKQSLMKLSNEEVVVKIIHGGVGAINESDVILASASNAIIIGFNVRPDATAKETADREGVDLRLYSVIYNAIEDVEAAMKGMLDPIFEEKVLGHAEVRQIFKASGIGTIAGSYVLDGMFERGCSARIIRDGVVIHDGALASLKRFKDDVKEVKAGYECGFVFEKYNDLKEEDRVEAYKMVEVPR